MRRMFKLIFMLSVLALLLSGCSSEKKEENPDFSYVTNTTNEYVRIIRYKGEGSEVVIPEEIAGKPVKEIAASTFENTPHVTSITIHAGITKIGDPSFQTLPNLKTIQVAEDNVGFTVVDGVLFHKKMKTLYCYPQGLEAESYTVPASVTTIGAQAFVNSPLKSIDLGDNVTKIYAGAFQNSKKLSEIKFSPKTKQIYESAFAGCTALTNVTLPASTTSLGNDCFKGCVGLTEMVLPESVVTLGSGVFMDCTALTRVSVPNKTIQRVAEQSFSGCVSLTDVEFGAELKGIADQAFMNCEKLTSFENLSTVTVLGSQAFAGCTALADATLPDALVTIGSRAFEGTPYLDSLTGDFAMTQNGVVLLYRGTETNVTVPQGATYISRLNDQVQSVTLPEGVIAIADGAFADCVNLEKVALPASLTSIGIEAFKNCERLNDFVIPAAVQTIGTDAFTGCKSITAFRVETGNTAYNVDKGVLYNTRAKYLIAYPAASEMKEYKVMTNCDRISAGAVRGAQNLETFDASGAELMKRVEKYGFADCPKLTTVKFHQDFAVLEDYAFLNCVSLTNYDTNYTMSEIGAGAFMNCKSLTRLTLEQPIAKIGAQAFEGADALELVVYSGTVGEEYAEAYDIRHVVK